MQVAPDIMRSTAHAAVDARVESGMAVDRAGTAHVAREEGTVIMKA